MATVTYINNNMQTLATAMQRLVTMGYFASIEYDSENDAVVCYDANENAVLTLTSDNGLFSATFRFDDGATKTVTLGSTSGSNNRADVRYLYVCSGGAYLNFYNSSTSSYAQVGEFFISLTNNTKVGILCTGSGNTVSAKVSTVYALATDDDATQINTAFAFGSPTTRNQTTLMKIPTCSAPNVVSDFPDVFYTFTSQYPYTGSTATPPQNFKQDGKRYLWTGCFAIRDEEAS